MIEAGVWLSQIIGYCKFITDDDAVKKAWVNADASKTSVSSFDELYEQIFDDLDSDNFDVKSLEVNGNLVIKIKNFISCMHESNEIFGNNSMPEAIILSRQWSDLKRSASTVLSAVDC